MHAISNEGPKQRGLAWSMFSLPLLQSSSQHVCRLEFCLFYKSNIAIDSGGNITSIQQAFFWNHFLNRGLLNKRMNP